MRLFFAICPEGDVRLTLSARRLEVARLTGGRPTLPVSLHLTMVFVGNVPQKRLLEMKMVASRVRAAPFRYTVDTAGCFATARIAWLASDQPPQALFDLQKALHDGVRAADFDVDRRTFRPHITVARHITDAIETYPISPCSWDVDKFVLVKTEQDASGVRYEVIDQWPLIG
ncbi:MAG: RNA 2',3'-cyclic phosphodiesterase [Rhodocyclaceae bacterium]|nr:RNA 2',3'-cyclic phosphodiesterase [Rhodocyclaceae bacterium]